MESTTSKTTPKLSKPTLEIKNNYFIVHDKGLFNYFAIKIDPDTLDLNVMRFEKAPPVLVDGVLILNRKLYEVPAQDLVRGIVRKSREIKVERDNHGSATPNSVEPVINTSGSETQAVVEKESSSDRSSAVRYNIEQGVIDPAELEIAKAADAAWEDQIHSLLDLVSSQEGGEWEVESVAQP